MPRIKLYVNTGFAGAGHVDYEDFDDAKWAAMTEAEREKELEEMAQDYMANRIDFGAIVVGASE